MNETLLKLVAKFTRYAVLHREEVKNDLPTINKLVRNGFVQKTYKSGRVFYELTEKALPLLEHHRKKLLEEAKMKVLLESRNTFYPSLLGDVRFLDEKKAEAKEFLFLGDWQLLRPVVFPQLELAKLRFYEGEVAPRRKKAA